VTAATGCYDRQFAAVYGAKCRTIANPIVKEITILLLSERGAACTRCAAFRALPLSNLYSHPIHVASKASQR